MLARYSAFLALLALQASAWTKTCPQGSSITSTGSCQVCPVGTYRPIAHTSTNQATTCFACTAGTQSNTARTACTPCPNGKFSTGGTMCQDCPAGQSNNSLRDGCSLCQPGTYNNVAGGTCDSCPGGQFNNVQGAKSCCFCCAGWYSTTNGGATGCTKCPTDKKYSDVGSNRDNDCDDDKNNSPNPTTGCAMSGNVCPNTTAPGTVGTNITKRKRRVHCTKGFTSCPRLSGRARTECVDTENDPESCGGCVHLDGTGKGKDCTAEDGVNASRCVKSRCVIDSCLKGFIKWIDGTSCVTAPRTGFDPAHRNKRSMRHNIY